MRMLTGGEVSCLLPCLEALADHHNRVSTHFAGTYPGQPHHRTLADFAAVLESGGSKIAVTEESGLVTGFCKIDLGDRTGKLDYLAVLPAHRGKGLGKALMDWAMAEFRRHGAEKIEVVVLACNEARTLYEQYGFRLSAQVLRLDP